MGERVEALVGQQAYKFLAIEARLQEAEAERDKAKHELDVLVKALVDQDHERYVWAEPCHSNLHLQPRAVVDDVHAWS